jgi:hypothetical protein
MAPYTAGRSARPRRKPLNSTLPPSRWARDRSQAAGPGAACPRSSCQMCAAARFPAARRGHWRAARCSGPRRAPEATVLHGGARTRCRAERRARTPVAHARRASAAAAPEAHDPSGGAPACQATGRLLAHCVAVTSFSCRHRVRLGHRALASSPRRCRSA